MITIAYEPINKRYSASVFSRGFCLSNICYFLVIIIPLLLLVNINYSWPQYSRVMLTPTIYYKAYQLNCLNADDTIIYNSNFESQIGTKNYNNILSASIQDNILLVEGAIYSNQLLACSIQIYLFVELETAVKSIVNLPLNFYSQNQNTFLSTAAVMGNAHILSNSPLPQSSILTTNQSEYSPQNSFSFMQNFKYAGSRNITINLIQNYRQIQTNQVPADNMFSFQAKIKILKKQYVKEAALIDKLRDIGPIFIFLAILLYYFIIDPLVDWMIENRIYSGRVFHAKVKKD